ncbi:hypothetical protein R1sor_015476 [Riccia sorocarpa]|uniref:Uncharacterized protein n=1 Tax=Riccia sorocarpa TaxID=122646 RepID=A0ABD3HF19_9MARC
MQPKMVYMYMGAPIGTELTQTQLLSFCTNRMTEKLKYWENRMLSFEARVILIRHVLLAVLVFYLQVVGVSKKAAATLETLANIFLWGRDVEGNIKTSLAKWSEVKRDKFQGRLGVKDVWKQGMAIFAKQACRFIDTQSEGEQWKKLMQSFVMNQKRKRSSLRGYSNPGCRDREPSNRQTSDVGLRKHMISTIEGLWRKREALQNAHATEADSRKFVKDIARSQGLGNVRLNQVQG